MDCKRSHKRLKIALAIVGAVIVVMIIAMAVYFGTYYHSVDVDEYFTDSDTVTVTETDSGWLFDGEGEDAALIFYPGAKVEASAYAPLLYELAEEGVDCFLVKMPLRMAIFGVNKALDITDAYDYETWILAGHSLGGAMAASCAASNPDSFDVLLLLAAYTTKEIDEGVTVLSLYGSEDGVLNMDSVESGRDLVPEDYTEICIEGGNHAQFGSYGEQDGDGTATITAEEQRQAVIDALTDLLEEESDLDETVSEEQGNSDEEDSQTGMESSDTEDTGNTESEAITEDEAQDIAIADSGLSESEIKYINIWTEKEDDQWLYAVEFGTYDDTEYKYEIDLYTGEIAASYIESH